jgi:L-seryl-tRNA(Ser) seleniumtransferase
LHEEHALREVPVLRMLGTPLEELRRRAEGLAEQLRGLAGLAAVTATEDIAYVGGGSLPDQGLKSWVVEIEADSLSDAELARRLRLGTPAVMARLRGGKLVLDVRTIFTYQEGPLIEAVRNALRI